MSNTACHARAVVSIVLSMLLALMLFPTSAQAVTVEPVVTGSVSYLSSGDVGLGSCDARNGAIGARLSGSRAFGSPGAGGGEIVQVALGDMASAAVKSDGSLWTWGYNNEYGSLGIGTATYNTWAPAKVMDDVVRASMGYFCSAVIASDGSLWIWGRGSNGELGDGTYENSLSPKCIFKNGRWLYGSDDSTADDLANNRLLGGGYLSAVKARCMLGFLFNTDELTDEQLNRNDFFKLMTGQLSGEEELKAAIQYGQFESEQLSDWTGKIGAVTDKSRQMLIDYLSTKTSGDLAADVAGQIVNETMHDIANRGLEYVTDTYLIHGGDLQDMEYEKFWLAKLAWDEIKNLGGLVDKVQEYRENLKAITGKVTVKKGLKAGTYKLKVRIKAAGNESYKSARKTVTLKVKVK